MNAIQVLSNCLNILYLLQDLQRCHISLHRSARDPLSNDYVTILQKYNDVVFADEWGKYLCSMGDNPYFIRSVPSRSLTAAFSGDRGGWPA